MKATIIVFIIIFTVKSFYKLHDMYVLLITVLIKNESIKQQKQKIQINISYKNRRNIIHIQEQKKNLSTDLFINY
jgi:hypothetical protein